MQSRKMSAMESIANLILGYVISVVLLYTIMPLYGYYPDFSTSNQMVLWFTVASFLRSYGLRRLFNALNSDTKPDNNSTKDNKNTNLVKIEQNLDGYIITISLEIEEKMSLALFFVDRVRELFGTNYEVKVKEDNRIEAFIKNYKYSSPRHLEEKIAKYQELIDVVMDGGYNSYEELIIKSFDLNLSPK